MPLKTWTRRERDGGMESFVFAVGFVIVLSRRPWTVSFGYGRARVYGQSPSLLGAMTAVRKRLAERAVNAYAGVE